MEQAVTFLSGDIEIEGLVERGSEERGVIITHPHPLYGGQMDNPVVETTRDAYREMGYTTLRFNFRGTGKSKGRHDNGVGEQEDLKSAIAYLDGLGIPTIDLAGYSFGAWVSLKVSSRTDRIRSLVLISPPVDFMDFSGIRNVDALRLVICGDRDEYAATGTLHRMLPLWNKDTAYVELSGCDHFYSGFMDQLNRSLTDHIRYPAVP